MFCGVLLLLFWGLVCLFCFVVFFFWGVAGSFKNSSPCPQFYFYSSETLLLAEIKENPPCCNIIPLQPFTSAQKLVKPFRLESMLHTAPSSWSWTLNFCSAPSSPLVRFSGSPRQFCKFGGKSVPVPALRCVRSGIKQPICCRLGYRRL